MDISQQVQKLISEKKNDEARALIEGALNESITGLDQGELLVRSLAAAMQLKTEMNNEQSANLDVYINILKEINKQEKKLDKLQNEVEKKRKTLM